MQKLVDADKQKVGLIGAIIVVAIALIGGLVLTARGVEVPAWLTSLLAVLGTGFAWFVQPPKGGGK